MDRSIEDISSNGPEKGPAFQNTEEVKSSIQENNSVNANIQHKLSTYRRKNPIYKQKKLPTGTQMSRASNNFTSRYKSTPKFKGGDNKKNNDRRLNSRDQKELLDSMEYKTKLFTKSNSSVHNSNSLSETETKKKVKTPNSKDSTDIISELTQNRIVQLSIDNKLRQFIDNMPSSYQEDDEGKELANLLSEVFADKLLNSDLKSELNESRNSKSSKRIILTISRPNQDESLNVIKAEVIDDAGTPFAEYEKDLEDFFETCKKYESKLSNTKVIHQDKIISKDEPIHISEQGKVSTFEDQFNISHDIDGTVPVVTGIIQESIIDYSEVKSTDNIDNHFQSIYIRENEKLNFSLKRPTKYREIISTKDGITYQYDRQANIKSDIYIAIIVCFTTLIFNISAVLGASFTLNIIMRVIRFTRNQLNRIW